MLPVVAEQHFTTWDIYQLIQNHSLQWYMYNENRSGCLFWTKQLIQKMQDKGYLQSDAFKSAESFVKTKRDSRSGKFSWWIPEDDGTFTDPWVWIPPQK